MTELLDLGALYVSDFLAADEEPRADPAGLRLVMDDATGVVHLAEQPPAELMWGRYWYRSGTNATMRAELFDIVQQVRELVHLDGDAWVDIASNDGTLLSHVKDAFPFVQRIGVDPVAGEIHDEAVKHGTIEQAPFTEEVAAAINFFLTRKAKVVTCIAMFYDLLDPTDFLAGVHRLLDRDGVFVLQMSYTPLMLEQLAFDNICHEHARYYTLTTLKATLERAGFRVVDCELNDTNGGSFRVAAQHAHAAPLRTQPWRDVADMRVASLLAYEATCGYNTPYAWRVFADRLEALRREVCSFIDGVRSAGARVWAYGASTKGNTLLQYFGLNHTMIDGIAERQESKWGLRTVGTNIPIVSEAEWREAAPEYTLMLPWHFQAEFCEREADYLDNGGRFIVPCPRFEIIGDGPAMQFGDGRKPA
jgi:NDP-4-keto-2,6-dideoxyhexose 3-C-methyltransferase